MIRLFSNKRKRGFCKRFLTAKFSPACYKRAKTRVHLSRCTTLARMFLAARVLRERERENCCAFVWQLTHVVVSIRFTNPTSPPLFRFRAISPYIRIFLFTFAQSRFTHNAVYFARLHRTKDTIRYSSHLWVNQTRCFYFGHDVH